ncbi:MAG: DUF6677 family protein [Thermoanaerobaculia bacterium]|jgi:hypothetical protein
MSGLSIVAMALALVLPGSGHFLLGRRRRAVAFFAIVVSMLAVGLLAGGKVYAFIPGRLMNNLATMGAMGSGVLYFIARRIADGGDVLAGTFEHGTAFTLTAGLMNLLLVLDAGDIAAGRKP